MFPTISATPIIRSRRRRYFDTSNTLPLGNAVKAQSLDELLAQSDCVTLHVPDVGATRNLIGARELAKMKKGAHLINNARGSVVDLEALRSAIEEFATARLS